MDLMFEQLWKDLLSSDISVNASLETNNNRIKRRDFDIFSSLIIAGDGEKSKEFLIDFFKTTPIWNPLAVTVLLQKTAEYFYSIGQYDNAIQFAERGLQWDSIHPELIALLVKSYSQLQSERALFYYDFFKEASFPENLLSGNVLPDNSAQHSSYSPVFSSLQKIDDAHLFRLMIFQTVSLYRRPLFESIDALRSHALACIAGGHLHMALVAVRLALFRLKDPLYISGLNPFTIQIKSRWAKVMDELICRKIDSDGKEKALFSGLHISERLYDRKNAIEELMNMNDMKGVFCFVMDPVPEISFLACQYLIENGEEKKVAPYIITASEIASVNKEAFGELKPHLLLRLIKPQTISAMEKISQKGIQVQKSTDVAPEPEKLSGEPEDKKAVKKVVRRRLVSKEKEPEETPVKKKAVTKKAVAKKVTRKKV